MNGFRQLLRKVAGGFWGMSVAGGGTIEIEKPDLASPEGFKREVETWSGIWRDQFDRGALVRNKDGSYTVKDLEAVTRLEQHEEEMLKLRQQAENLDAIIKANASRFNASDPDKLTLSRAAMVLAPGAEKEDDLKGYDRTYFNVMALTAAELSGVCSLDAHRTPGLEHRVRLWASNPRNASTVNHIDRLHELNDRIVTKFWWLSSNPTWAKQNSDMEKAMRSFKEWPEYERLWGEVLISMGITRAMDETTSTKGLNLVPTIMAGSINDIVEAQLRVASLIRSFTMTSKTFEWPILTGHIVVYTPGEGTGDHATYDAGITASNPTFGKPVWTAKKLAGLAFVSSEVDEDAIEGGVGIVQNDMGIALGHGKEDAFINGEAAGVTMDGATFNPAGGRRRFVNGFRFHALMTGSYPAKVDAANAVLTGTMGINLQQLMGAWGVDPTNFVWVTGYRGYHNMRKMAPADWLPMGAEPNGVINTRGAVGRFLNSPVVLSEKVLDNNAAGIYDGITTNRGTVLGIMPSRWAYGDRRAVTVDTSEHVAFRNDQIAVRGTLRGDLQPMDTPSATITPVGIIYNLA